MINRSVSAVLHYAKEQLHGFETGNLDAEVLLMHVLKVSRPIILAWPDRQLTDADVTEFENLISRRLNHEPVAYLTGRQAFHDVVLQVSPDVLIPRPETEHVVDWVLETYGDATELKVVDLGTGSGAIAIALAKANPHWQIIATDRCEKALAVARDNASFYQLDNIVFHLGDWCDALPEAAYDIIISNPPYIAIGDPHLLMGELQHEPTRALVAKNAGFSDLFHIAKEAKAYLKPGGALVLEHGYTQAPALTAYLEDQAFADITTIKDLAGLDRVTIGKYLG
jgi:release factor glutamine methyltransferase